MGLAARAATRVAGRTRCGSRAWAEGRRSDCRRGPGHAQRRVRRASAFRGRGDCGASADRRCRSRRRRRRHAERDQRRRRHLPDRQGWRRPPVAAVLGARLRDGAARRPSARGVEIVDVGDVVLREIATYRGRVYPQPGPRPRRRRDRVPADARHRFRRSAAGAASDQRRRRLVLLRCSAEPAGVGDAARRTIARSRRCASSRPRRSCGSDLEAAAGGARPRARCPRPACRSPRHTRARASTESRMAIARDPAALRAADAIGGRCRRPLPERRVGAADSSCCSPLPTATARSHAGRSRVATPPSTPWCCSVGRWSCARRGGAANACARSPSCSRTTV